jgi:hypothetical protein
MRSYYVFKTSEVYVQYVEYLLIVDDFCIKIKIIIVITKLMTISWRRSSEKVCSWFVYIFSLYKTHFKIRGWYVSL